MLFDYRKIIKKNVYKMMKINLRTLQKFCILSKSSWTITSRNQFDNSDSDYSKEKDNIAGTSVNEDSNYRLVWFTFNKRNENEKLFATTHGTHQKIRKLNNSVDCPVNIRWSATQTIHKDLVHNPVCSKQFIVDAYK